MLNQSAVSRVQTNLDELFKGNLASGDAYIKIQLTPEIIALFPMTQVQESLIIDSEQITALPGMPESTIGMMSSRDRVFCIFDLAQLLNLPSWSISPRQYQIVVLQTIEEPSIYVGFAVTQLQGIIRLENKEISSSLENIFADLAHFILGTTKQEDTVLPILDFQHILNTLSNLS